MTVLSHLTTVKRSLLVVHAVVLLSPSILLVVQLLSASVRVEGASSTHWGGARSGFLESQYSGTSVRQNEARYKKQVVSCG